MRIEILETIKEGRDEFVKDDIRTVSDELGKYFCDNGWARDVTGQANTAERETAEVSITPDNVTHATEAGEANG